MENEKEEGGVTLGYVFRTIFSQKWLALLIAAVITVAGTLGLYFLGKTNEVYNVSFVTNLPGSQSSASYFEFPDGQTQHFTEAVSYENLEKVKESNAAFGDIDIKKMYEKGDISVRCDISEIVEGSKEYSVTYVLTAKSKYFKSQTVARDFLSAVSNYPNEYLKSMKIDYTTALEASNDTIMYDEQIEFINSEYADLISSYGGNFVVKNGRTLNYFKSRLQAFVDLGEISRLKTNAIENGYLKIDEETGEVNQKAKAKYEAERYNKERERDIANKALTNALDKLSGNDASGEGSGSATGVIMIDAQAVIALTSQIARLDKELEEIDNFINNGKIDKDFDGQVKDVYNKVKEFTDEFAGISSTVYTTRSAVSYLNTNVIIDEGGRSWVMSLVISVCAAIVLAAIIAYIVGWSLQRKKAEKSAVSSPVFVEAQAQAAVTDETVSDENDKE